MFMIIHIWDFATSSFRLNVQVMIVLFPHASSCPDQKQNFKMRAKHEQNQRRQSNSFTNRSFVYVNSNVRDENIFEFASRAHITLFHSSHTAHMDQPAASMVYSQFHYINIEVNTMNFFRFVLFNVYNNFHSMRMRIGFFCIFTFSISNRLLLLLVLAARDCCHSFWAYMCVYSVIRIV